MLTLRLAVFACVVLSSLVGSIAQADDRNVSGALLVVDWLQTRHISSTDQFYETNPILGEHPSRGNVNLYFATALLINYTMPEEWAPYVAFVQASVVDNNVRLGVQLKW